MKEEMGTTSVKVQDERKHKGGGQKTLSTHNSNQVISYIHPHANTIEIIVIRTTYEPLRYGPLSVFPAELVELAAE
jgi:hypothetical protein